MESTGESSIVRESSRVRPVEPGVICWMRLARVYHALDRAVAEHVGCWDLSAGQFDVLAQIGGGEGVTQNQLAEALLVTKSNVCQILGRMQRRGLVEKRQDGRSNRLYLTTTGRRLYEEIVPDHQAMVGRRMQALSPEETSQLAWLLRKLERGQREAAPDYTEAEES